MGIPAVIAKRLYRKLANNDISGESAKLAYYAFLSLFPLVLVVFATTGIVGGDAAFSWIMEQIAGAVPAEAAQYLGRFVKEVTSHSRPGLLSVSVLGSLWSASNVLTALSTGLNRVYGVQETRAWWKLRVLALVLLAFGTIAGLGSAAVIVAGPELANSLGVGFVWRIVSLPLMFFLLVAMLFVTYFVLPDRDQSQVKREVVVGAVVGSILWLGGAALFRLYVSHFGSFSRTYGFVGAVIMLLLWLYLSGFAVLFGAEVAAVLEEVRMGPKARSSARELYAGTPA